MESAFRHPAGLVQIIWRKRSCRYLFAIIPALLAGATLVPHASGGLIATGASGYIAGTFLGKAALDALLLGGGVVGLAGAAGGAVLGGVIGSAGFMGTGIGASGLTGLGISLGLISTTPLWIPAASAVAAVGSLGFAGHRLARWMRRRKLRKSLSEEFESMFQGAETNFTADEIKRAPIVLEGIVKKNASAPRGQDPVYTEEEATFLQKYLLRAYQISVDEDGHTVPQIAVEGGRAVELATSTDGSANPNIRAKYDVTPLHTAATFGQADVVSGADRERRRPEYPRRK